MNEDQWHQGMTCALQEARRACIDNEVPVGAALFCENGNLIASSHNRTVTNSDPTAHAEIEVIRMASARLKTPRLLGCHLFVTLEPCAMCAGAIVAARLCQVTFGAYDAKAGAVHSLGFFFDSPAHNHRVKWQGGVMAMEAKALLQEFFQSKR